MGITGLIPFLEKASRRANVDEFSGCTVAIDSYCWLHKGAFACADKLVRGENTDVHIKYCLKYVTMLLSKNIKPILVFDGRHLPAKAQTEAKRRESRNTSKKRAAELLSLGQVEEARSYIRRCVDITHAMALALIKECRARNVDCIVAPYEADAQLAYLNIRNIAHLVITEDSDLILFGCTKVLFKMDLAGAGTLVEAVRLPLAMRCPVERYTFDHFRRMCILSGCDYLPSLPGIGLAKARQFVTASQDSDFANALKKLPSFFNKSSLVVSDEYRASFLQAEATFKHQYVYDPIQRRMLRLTEPDDYDVEEALCSNAGELLEPDTAFQLALGNLDPFTLKKMDDWHPDHRINSKNIKTDGWKEKSATHASMWSKSFEYYLDDPCPWQKKVKKLEPIISTKTKAVKKVVNLVSKYVPETQDQSLTIESLSSMYCVEKPSQKMNTQPDSQDVIKKHERVVTEDEVLKEMTVQKEKSPILENKDRSFRKRNTSYSIMKRLSKFPRTELNGEVVESKFFSSIEEDTRNDTSIVVEESPEISRSPLALKSLETSIDSGIDSLNNRLDTQGVEVIEENNSQKENSPVKSQISPRSRNPFKVKPMSELVYESQDTVIENTYPMETLVTPVDSQASFGELLPSPPTVWRTASELRPDNQPNSQPGSRPNSQQNSQPSSRSNSQQNSQPSRQVSRPCRPSGLKRTQSLPKASGNQPTLLSMFGFQKKPVLKR